MRNQYVAWQASTGERFDEADANSDGQLSVEEYSGLFAPSAQSDAPDFHADASGTMEFADKDKDGVSSPPPPTRLS